MDDEYVTMVVVKDTSEYTKKVAYLFPVILFDTSENYVAWYCYKNKQNVLCNLIGEMEVVDDY